jgi:hypothetical protein
MSPLIKRNIRHNQITLQKTFLHLVTHEHNIKCYVPSLVAEQYDWMSFYASMTTDTNISMVSNTVMHYALPMKHYEVCLDILWICIKGKYPETAKNVLNILMQFSTTY